MAPELAAGKSSLSMTIDVTGHDVLLVNDTDNTALQYTIGVGGVLESSGLTTVATGMEPIAITTTP